MSLEGRARRLTIFIGEEDRSELNELVTEGLVIVDDVDVVKYVGRSGGEA